MENHKSNDSHLFKNILQLDNYITRPFETEIVCRHHLHIRGKMPSGYKLHFSPEHDRNKDWKTTRPGDWQLVIFNPLSRRRFHDAICANFLTEIIKIIKSTDRIDGLLLYWVNAVMFDVHCFVCKTTGKALRGMIIIRNSNWLIYANFDFHFRESTQLLLLDVYFTGECVPI